MIARAGVLVLLVAAPAALAQDAGPSDAGPVDAGLPDAGGGDAGPADGGAAPSCDDETAFGRCEGDTLIFCREGVVERVDCTATDLECGDTGASGAFGCVGDPDDDEGCAHLSSPTDADAWPVVAVLSLVAAGLRRRRRAR